MKYQSFSRVFSSFCNDSQSEKQSGNISNKGKGWNILLPSLTGRGKGVSLLYDRGIHWVFSHKRTTLGMAVLSIPLCVLMFYLLPKERMPETSRTELAVRIDWNENIHLEENRRRTEELERFCKEGVQGSKFKVQDEADANRRGTPCGHPNETVNINHWAPTRDAPTVNEKQSASSVDEESVPHGNSSLFTLHSSLIIESQAHIGTRQYLLDREQTSTSETDLYLRTATADGPALLQTAISSWMATHYPQATVHFYAPENVFEKVFDTNEPQLVVELYNSDKARLQEVDRLQALQQMVDDAAGEASEGLAIQEQIGLTIDRERLLLYGVSYDEIVRTLKTALRENKVATLRSYQNYLPISISGQEQTLDEILTHTLIEVPSSVRGERQRVPLRSFITTFPAKDLKTITAGMAGEYVPLVYTDTRQAEKIVEKVKKGVFGNEERRVKSEELVQSSRFKVQDEADATRRGTPCGYPNETANINHWAPTRDAPTVNEKQSASSVDEGTVPHGHSSFFTLHSSLNGATWSPSFSGAFFSSHRMIDELVVVLFISLLLMYFILAAQFESFLQPLIVLAEIPIDLGFALVVMAVCGVSLNLMSAIGIVVSCGIIINDSILKLDMINVLRKEGVPLMEAIHTAGTRRLRSIIMTSLTTILAMMPLLFTHDLGSELQTPLAIAMIATMTVGTLVSLFVIPLVYWGVYRRPTPSPSLNGGE
ncbi:MAG: efflux RND transporter permease subunit [Bacteroidaceae bacterium]|nr:efflux RND transporter permease subunit [Bacteroidaceae bacterium]